MDKAIPNSLAVYAIYGLNPVSAEQETMGWLTIKISGSVCNQNLRTLETVETSDRSGKGTSIPLS
jgi:hypothetical protein